MDGISMKYFLFSSILDYKKKIPFINPEEREGAISGQLEPFTLKKKIWNFGTLESRGDHIALMPEAPRLFWLSGYPLMTLNINRWKKNVYCIYKCIDSGYVLHSL